PQGGVAAAEGGGVLGDPAEGAAQRQQPDPAVRARGGRQQLPDRVHRRRGQGGQQQPLPVVAPLPAVVVVALGLQLQIRAGGEGVQDRAQVAQGRQVALGVLRRAGVG